MPGDLLKLDLKIYRGNVFGWTDSTEVARVDIGRSPVSRVRLDDPSVAWEHALVEIDADNTVRFTEIASETMRALKSGESLFIGVFRIEVRFDTKSSSPNIIPTKTTALVAIKQLRSPAISVAKDLAPCPTCGYWLEAKADFCTDCGARSQHPDAEWKPVSRWNWRRLGTFSGLAWGLGMGAVFAATSVGALALLVGGAGIGLFMGDEMGKFRIGKRELVERTKDSLDATSLAIDALRAKNTEAIARIEKSRKTIAEMSDEAERTEAMTMLDRRETARLAERDALAVRKWSVEFARWANCYLPVYFDLDKITFDETEKRIAFTKQLEASGRGMIELWRTERASSSSKGRELISTFEEAIEGLVVIRGQLARANAQLADPDATHLPNMPGGDALREELEKFQSLCGDIAAGKFSMGMEELEAERLRLEAEAEIADDV